MKKRFLLFCLSILFLSSAVAQTKTYKIVSKKDTLGELVVKKNVNGTFETYEYLFDMKLTIMTNIHIKYSLVSKYHDGDLIMSSVDNVVNGRVFHSSRIYRKDDHYLIRVNNQLERKIDSKIDYSMVKLLFNEPVNIKNVFSETTGKNHELKLVDTKKYSVQQKNGVSNYYYYDQKGLKMAEINNSTVKFKLIRKV